MGKWLALVLVGAIGCTPPRVVYVPTPCPEPAKLYRPPLPISNMDKTWTPKQIEDALWQSLTIETGYAKMLEAILYGPKSIEKKPK